MANEVLALRTLRGEAGPGLSDGSWDTEEDSSQIHRGEGGAVCRQRLEGQGGMLIVAMEAGRGSGWSLPSCLWREYGNGSTLPVPFWLKNL